MEKERIVITLGEPFIARNIFATDWWSYFLNNIDKKYEIFVLTYPKDVENFSARFGSENVTFIKVAPKYKSSKITSLALSLMRSCLSSKTNKWSRMRAYHRGDSSLVVTWFKNLFSIFFGDVEFVKKLLRKAILCLIDTTTVNSIKLINPKYAIITSMTNFDFDVPIAAACRKLKIKIIGMPRSWDNFTSHGLTRVMPDFLFVQNRYLAVMAKKHQLWRSEKAINIFGVPSYDSFFKEDVYSREELYEKLGLELDYDFIVYGAMGSFLFKNENELPMILNNVVKSLNKKIKIVYRMHPKFPIPSEFRNSFDELIFDKKKDDQVSANMDDNEMKYLRSLIFHSKLVITSASTFAIDAVVFNKSLILLNFDPIEGVDYWESVNRFFDHYDHFEEFVRLANPVIVDKIEKLLDVVRAGLKSDKVNYNRDEIINALVGPYEGESGVELAKSMLRIVNN